MCSKHANVCKIALKNDFLTCSIKNVQNFETTKEGQ